MSDADVDVHDVFGSDVDMSDLEVTEEKPSSKKKKLSRNADSDDEADVVDSDDDFGAAPKKKKKKPVAKRKSGDKGAAPSKRRKKLKKKSDADEDGEDEAPVDADEDDEEEREEGGDSDRSEAVDEEERKVEKAFAKSSGKKRKKSMNLEEMRQAAEELIRRMWKARDADLKAFKRDQPALQKLKMLPEVEEAVRKVELRSVLLQCKLLGALRLWLDPMPDGSLPNQSVRTRLLTMLDDFVVDDDWTGYLKESGGLGKIINYLSMKDTHDPNKRHAKKLMTRWARPIFDTQANYRDEQERPENVRRPIEVDATALQQESRYEKELKKSSANKFYARLPQPVSFNFQRMPEPAVQYDEEAARGQPESRKKASVERGLQRLKNSRRTGNARALNMSIEGRGLL